MGAPDRVERCLASQGCTVKALVEETIALSADERDVRLGARHPTRRALASGLGEELPGVSCRL